LGEPVVAGSEEARSATTGLLLAVAAVVCFSTSPVFTLWAAPLSPFEITVGRLTVGAMAVWGLARLVGQPFLPRRSHLPLFAVFGLITALHFLTYIASLSYTTIAHSLAIVYTAPIFVTLFSAALLREPILPRKWLGVLVAVAGLAVLVGFEARWTMRMVLGDLLALCSAITFGLYSVAGRSQREHYGLFTYAGTVYALAALWTLPAAAVAFSPAGYQARSLLAVLAAGLIPMAAGHTMYNAALRRTHATTVNLIATQEVTGGVLLGALLLSQVPQPNEIIGAAIALLGIAIVLI
jgi:drug/metabolite transporter (DMT)-like permease